MSEDQSTHGLGDSAETDTALSIAVDQSFHMLCLSGAAMVAAR